MSCTQVLAIVCFGLGTNEVGLIPPPANIQTLAKVFIHLEFVQMISD